MARDSEQIRNMTGFLLCENHFPSGKYEEIGVQVNSTVLGMLVISVQIFRRNSQGRRGNRVNESGEASGICSFPNTQNWQWWYMKYMTRVAIKEEEDMICEIFIEASF